MSVYSSNSKKPHFSAGVITAVVTVFWLVVFGAVTVYGIGGLQNEDLVSAVQPAAETAQ